MSAKLKWALIVGAVLLLGGAALVLGFWLAGADILGWFSTKWAFIVYFFAGAYAIFVGWLIMDEYVRGGSR